MLFFLSNLSLAFPLENSKSVRALPQVARLTCRLHEQIPLFLPAQLTMNKPFATCDLCDEHKTDVPVRVPGIWIRPGDWLYADGDGVVLGAAPLV